MIRLRIRLIVEEIERLEMENTKVSLLFEIVPEYWFAQLSRQFPVFWFPSAESLNINKIKWWMRTEFMKIESDNHILFAGVLFHFNDTSLVLPINYWCVHSCSTVFCMDFVVTRRTRAFFVRSAELIWGSLSIFFVEPL